MTFANYADLAAAYLEGTDYRVTVLQPEKHDVAVLAIHSGTIEPWTGLVAEAIAGHRYGFYEFAAIIPRGTDNPLHITATDFDEPRCTRLQAIVSRTVSVHGCTADMPVTYVGGLDLVLAAAIRSRLTQAGFHIDDAPASWGGSAQANICNRNLTGRGVQLELSRQQRDALAKDGTLLGRYAAAVSRAIEAH